MTGFVLDSHLTTDTTAFFLNSHVAGEITLLWDFDTANIDENVFTVDWTNPSEPEIFLKVRRTGAANNWIHWLFGLSGVQGLRPTFEIETTGRSFTEGYHSSWRPTQSPDLLTWTPSSVGFTALTDPLRIRFQFPEAFATDTVYLADHPPYTVGMFSDLAAALLADTSGLVSVSAAADEFGVIGTSPAETDERSRAIGENNIYGFVLGDDSPTSFGGPKRWMIVDAGMHPGEVVDGWYLEGLIDYFLNSSDLAAVTLRTDWKIGIYFCATPNGRKGGHFRTNFRSNANPNRDWDSFALAESVILRDAILADLDGAIEHVGLSLHSNSSRNVVTSVNYATENENEEQAAWLAALDVVDENTWSNTGTNIADSTAGWHTARGALVAITSEPGSRTMATVARYRQIGKRYLEATALVWPMAGGDAEVTPNDATHGHSADEVTFGQAHVLGIASAASSHTAGTVGFVQDHVLGVSDALHDHDADALTLMQVHDLGVSDGVHGHFADEAGLISAGVLSIADGAHGHVADALTLIQVHDLGIDDAAHGHAADNISLDISAFVIIAPATHGHAAAEVTLVQVHDLGVEDAVHSHQVNTVALAQVHALGIADATHAHAAEEAGLSSAGTLSIASAIHGHLAGSLGLAQVHALGVSAARHDHLADVVTLGQIHGLAIEGAVHGHLADVITVLESIYVLVPENAYYRVRPETIFYRAEAL